MRWRKAHRNKARALRNPRPRRRRPRFVFPFHQLSNPYLRAQAEQAWKEWLDKLVPPPLVQNSVMGQLHFRPITERRNGLARLLRPEPRRLTEIFRGIWLSQDKKCAECKQPLTLEDATKRGMSFEVTCQTCASKPKYFMIVDDIDEYPLTDDEIRQREQLLADLRLSEKRWQQYPRVEYALVPNEGVQCAECDRHHWIPSGDTLTIDFNGAASLCSTLRRVIREALHARQWVRIVRQCGGPMPEDYLLR